MMLAMAYLSFIAADAAGLSGLMVIFVYYHSNKHALRSIREQQAHQCWLLWDFRMWKFNSGVGLDTFVYSSTLGDTRLWVSPRLEYPLSL
jgi:hypothetical protein